MGTLKLGNQAQAKNLADPWKQGNCGVALPHINLSSDTAYLSRIKRQWAPWPFLVSLASAMAHCTVCPLLFFHQDLSSELPFLLSHQLSRSLSFQLDFAAFFSDPPDPNTCLAPYLSNIDLSSATSEYWELCVSLFNLHLFCKPHTCV